MSGPALTPETGPEGPREGALGASADGAASEHGAAAAGRVRTWSNRAGNQSCRAEVLRPTSEPELCRIVTDSAARGHVIRAVGTGHSFSDVALSDATLVDLVDYGRILAVDRSACTVTVQAGARIDEVAESMWTRGLAFTNPGDIDSRTVAGATQTASHGTGARFGNLASDIVGMRLIDGTGRVHELDGSHEPELFAAARASVGALGIVSTLTLRVSPAFNLHAVREQRSIDEVLERFDELTAANDHFEFLWVPGTRQATTGRNRRNHDRPNARSKGERWLHDRLGGDHASGIADRVVRRRPWWGPAVSRRLPSAGRVEFNDRSYRVFASRRRVRFVEMEYAVPIEATVEAFGRVRALVERLDYPVSLPIGVRTSAADDITLSTASGRSTGWVSVQVHRGVPYEEYFRGVESVMADLDGRPHWGKLHFRTAADLAPLYPGWDVFQELRARLDPRGTFQNPALTRVLGPVGG